VEWEDPIPFLAEVIEKKKPLKAELFLLYLPPKRLLGTTFLTPTRLTKATNNRSSTWTLMNYYKSWIIWKYSDAF
jgi:hypothetical protein